MLGDDDYTFYVSHVRKMFWLPVIWGVCNAPFQPWTIPLHVAAALVCIFCARSISVQSFRFLRFLVAINSALLAAFLSMSVALITMAPEQIRLALQPHLFGMAAMLGVFWVLWLLVFLRIWRSRWAQFEYNTRGNELSAGVAVSLMMGSGGMSFWRSGMGASLMAMAVGSSVWVGYRLGLDAKFIIASTLFYLLWPVLPGSVLAQYFTVREQPRIASIMLYR